MDMSTTILPKSDQINADDLIGGPRTIRITRVSANESSPEQPINVFYEGDNGKPFRPCKSMRRVMVAIWGPDANAYVGRQMTIYRDPNVRFGGMAVGGIRISHMSDMERDVVMALTETRAKRTPYQVRRLVEAEKPRAPAQSEGLAEVIISAREAAGRGSEAFRKWWKDHPQARAAVKPQLAELQAVAESADAGEPDDDPFDLPPADGSIPAGADAGAAVRERVAGHD